MVNPLSVFWGGTISCSNRVGPEMFVGQWLTSQEIDALTQVQFMGEAVSISHIVSTNGVDMNPTILRPAMSKESGRRGSSALVVQSV